MKNKNSAGNPSAPINASAIGHIAMQTLQTESSAKIWGHTSKGLFAVTENKKTLFITDQKPKGPLTINICSTIPDNQICKVEMQLQLAPAMIGWPHTDFIIELEPDTPIWNPTFADKLHLNIDLLLKRGKLLEDQMNNQYQNKRSWFSLSLNEAGFRGDSKTGLPTNLANHLLIALSSMDESKTYASLTPFLGLGEGLTPSGDDFLCGFLLAIHLWQGKLSPHFDLHSTSQRIVASAWQKTSTLSANLIKCAAIGSADERIINCLQWLGGSKKSGPTILEELLTYGNSSGADILAGILTFIQSSSAYIYRISSLS